MRIIKFIVLPLLILLLSLVWIQPADSAGSMQSQVVPVAAIVTRYGTTTGTTAALSLLDQSGSDNDPGKYIQVNAAGVPFMAEISFQLPNTIHADKVTSALLQVNFSGPQHTQQTWSWFIHDRLTHNWHPLGDNVGAQPDEWNILLFPISAFTRYASSNGQVRIRLTSDTTSNHAKLDYAALHLTYFPVIPTATRPSSTSMVTRPAYIYPITYTSTVTFTPTVTPTPTRTFTPTPTPACAAHDNAFECQVFFLINQERTSRGIPALTSDAFLHTAARNHSTEMAQNNYFSHTGLNGSSPGDRITAAGYSYTTWGENIAAGYNTPASVVAGWMASTMGHREAILNPNYVDIGIGYAFDGDSDYGHYWTADFGAPAD